LLNDDLYSENERKYIVNCKTKYLKKNKINSVFYKTKKLMELNNFKVKKLKNIL